MIAYITINIDPVIGHLGPLRRALVLADHGPGVIAGSFIFAGQLRRKGIESGHVAAMLVVVVPLARSSEPACSACSTTGALLAPPGSVVKPPYVGLAIYGVLTGGILALASTVA